MAISNEQLYVCGVKLLIVSLGVILAGVLFPYDFSLSEVRLRNSSSHVFPHILLFIPFGFALACLLRKPGAGYSRNILVIVIGGICAPIAIEALQMTVPSRSASFKDMLANIGGVLVGVVGFVLFGKQLINLASRTGRRARKFLTMEMLIGTTLAYITAICFLSAVLQRATDLSSWSRSFPLLLGNEKTGERPWRGHVYHLQITNKSLSEDDIAHAFADDGLFTRFEGVLLASYDLMKPAGNYVDRSGHLADLVWRGEAPKNGDKQWLFGAKQWLETPTPAAALSQAIKRTSQFTLSATVASADPAQHGPARIVSVSRDHYQRNLTMGQEESSLVVRVRTGVTGKNGTNPQLVIPDVFVDDEPRHIVITYDGITLRVFINGVQRPRSLKLVPEAALSGRWLPVTADNMKGHKVLYYAWLFTPLGFLVGFASKTPRGSAVVKYVVAGLGIIGPAIILEGILTVLVGTLRPENLILAMLFSMAGVLLVVWTPKMDSNHGNSFESGLRVWSRLAYTPRT